MAVTSRWRGALARWAARGTAVLVVEVPGGWAVRVAVEQALLARGWREATSPADADALLVCGVAGEGWDEVLERTWAQMPGPRARRDERAVAEVEATLDALAASLRDDDAQRADAAARDLVAAGVEAGDDMNPGGLQLAGGEDDLRDGLEMDVLRVALGPVLPGWPAGLVLRTVLSGDVVVRARVEVLPGGAHGPVVEPGSAGDVARRLDAAAQVLTLAGAVDLAADAVRLRDAALPPAAPSPGLRSLSAPHGTPSGEVRSLSTSSGSAEAEEAHEVRGGAARLRERVQRSRVLAWALREADVATSSPTSSADSDVAQVSAPDNLRDVGVDARRRTRDDARTLLLGLLDPDAHDDDPRGRTRAALEALPERLVGVDVVTARLLVAALDLRTDTLDADDLASFAPADDEDDEHQAKGHGHADHGHMNHGHAHG